MTQLYRTTQRARIVIKTEFNQCVAFSNAQLRNDSEYGFTLEFTPPSSMGTIIILYNIEYPYNKNFKYPQTVSISDSAGETDDVVIIKMSLDKGKSNFDIYKEDFPVEWNKLGIEVLLTITIKYNTNAPRKFSFSSYKFGTYPILSCDFMIGEHRVKSRALTNIERDSVYKEGNTQYINYTTV